MFDNLNKDIETTQDEYIEDEIKRLEWLRSLPIPFTIPAPGISKEYLEECIKYCTESNEKQKTINELRKETSKQELKLIKASYLNKSREIKKEKTVKINFPNNDIIDVLEKEIRSFKRIRCIRDKTS